jgi:hypothetical protein
MFNGFAPRFLPQQPLLKKRFRTRNQQGHLRCWSIASILRSCCRKIPAQFYFENTKAYI